MDILDRIISAESSGNLEKANKPNKTSSALGLGQSIDGPGGGVKLLKADPNTPFGIDPGRQRHKG